MVVFYSTSCPRCKVLRAKLDEAKVEYIECGDVDKMRALGIDEVPVLGVEDTLYGFADAMAWIKKGEHLRNEHRG